MQRNSVSTNFLEKANQPGRRFYTPRVYKELPDMAPVTIEGHKDARGLGYYLGSTCNVQVPHCCWGHADLSGLPPGATVTSRSGCCWGPCRYPRAMPLPRPYRSGWPELHKGTMETSGLNLLPRAMCEPMVLLQLESMLTSVACVITVGHRNHAWWNLRSFAGQALHGIPQQESWPPTLGRTALDDMDKGGLTMPLV